MQVYYVEAGGIRYPIAMSSATVHVIPTKDAWRNLRTVYGGQIPWCRRRVAPGLDPRRKKQSKGLLRWQWY